MEFNFCVCWIIHIIATKQITNLSEKYSNSECSLTILSVKERSDFHRFYWTTSHHASILRMCYIMHSICRSICQRLASCDIAWWNHWNSERILRKSILVVRLIFNTSSWHIGWIMFSICMNCSWNIFVFDWSKGSVTFSHFLNIYKIVNWCIN